MAMGAAVAYSLSQLHTIALYDEASIYLLYCPLPFECFHLIAIINKASMYIFLVYASWCTCIRISLGYIPRIDRRAWTCSSFLGNTKFPKWLYWFITMCEESSCCSESLPSPDIVQLANVCQSGEYELVHHWILISAFLILNRVKYLSYIYESFMFPFLCLCLLSNFHQIGSLAYWCELLCFF